MHVLNLVEQLKHQGTAGETTELPELLNYIDGDVEAPQCSRENSLLNPNTLEPLQAQLASSEEQVERALASADQAHEHALWENTPIEERADVLDKIAERLSIKAVREHIASVDAMTTGAVISVTRSMADLAPFSFRGAAQYLREGQLEQRLQGKSGIVEYFRRPWGPALLVNPWNGPTAIGSHKLASALAAGAPCIFKPSEWAPHSALIMAGIIDDLDLPPGTFQLTCGSRLTGGLMVGDPRIKAISFTGGTAGGRAISHACADAFTPLQLELGGNNPMVVFADADLEQTAKGIAFGLTNLNAQWCRALGRVIVHRSVKEALLERVKFEFSKVVLGSSLDPCATMGPQIHEQQYRSTLSAIERLQSLGGTAIQNTPLPDLPGYFIPPTLVDGCAAEHTREEIFGPVATVHCFDTEAEALALANGTDYGLAAYVYSSDETLAFEFSRRLRTGGVKINGYNLLSLSPSVPRGAWGISGLGEEGTGHTIDFFTGARVVGPAPTPGV
jgi:acyl-CoA reductase-like NAD-dependent aldehyde dehydrogenase